MAVAEKDKREEEGTITRNTTEATVRARKEQSPFRVWAESSRRPSRNLRRNTATTCVSEDDRLTGQVSRKTNAEGKKKTRQEDVGDDDDGE